MLEEVRPLLRAVETLVAPSPPLTVVVDNCFDAADVAFVDDIVVVDFVVAHEK